MASKYWLKLYHEMLDDPKVAKLEDSAWRRWVECLLLAGEMDAGGFLPTVEDMAWRLRVDNDTLSRSMSRLALSGLVEIKEHDEGEGWYVTQFAERQAPSDPAKRMREYRKRKRKVTKEKEKEEKEDKITDTDTDTYSDVTSYVTDVTKRNAEKADTPPNGFWNIPNNLRDSPDFINAWASWLRYVDEKRINFVETQAVLSLDTLATYGHNRATEAIKHSIEHGWRSIYEKKVDNKNGRTSSTTDQSLANIDAAFEELNL